MKVEDRCFLTAGANVVVEHPLFLLHVVFSVQSSTYIFVGRGGGLFIVEAPFVQESVYSVVPCNEQVVPVSQIVGS